MLSQVIEPAAANRDSEYSLCNFDPDGEIPNHPQLPVMIWRGVVSSNAGVDAVKALFKDNGWRRVWTWRVFDY